MTPFKKLRNKYRMRFEHAKGYLSDFQIFFVHDPSHRLRALQGIFSTFLAIISFLVLVTTSEDSTFTTAFFIGSIATIYGLLSALVEVRSLVNERRFIELRPGWEALIHKQNSFRVDRQTDVFFKELIPQEKEHKMGFVSVKENSCDEVAFVSEDIDQKLTSTLRIEISDIQVKKSKYVGSFDDQQDFQFRFLHTTIKGRERTTNDNKVRLISPLSNLAEKVELEKTDYFRSLITNEAFRSSIERRTGQKRFYDDFKGTRWFPAIKENGNYVLKQHRIDGISGHIGTTGFALSSEGKLMFARQRKKNYISGGTLVFRGSGSMDWSDLLEAKKSNNFKEVISRSIARELVEEVESKQNKIQLYKKRKLIESIIPRIITIGFFRWVDRCGKPEFLGAVRLPDNFSIYDFDDFEVGYHEIIDDLKPLQSDKDVVDLYEYIRSQTKYAIGLSTLLAIRRAAQICSYTRRSSPKEREVKLRFLQALKLDETF
ncbi:hypothetical protein [Lentilitoribacter sp. Alg239-R112]|uniref:hypothetical protein n=1 Tax=Lentilitoribacter sp. Alg239-R112 TaxID=2305987 RepID=UPI0013A6C813|nr:hypothetical protein [Lentilitoribacter sp. Alg239-R112]